MKIEHPYVTQYPWEQTSFYVHELYDIKLTLIRSTHSLHHCSLWIQTQNYN